MLASFFYTVRGMRERVGQPVAWTGEGERVQRVFLPRQIYVPAAAAPADAEESLNNKILQREICLKQISRRTARQDTPRAARSSDREVPLCDTWRLHPSPCVERLVG
jgi:hypothetical protein